MRYGAGRCMKISSLLHGALHVVQITLNAWRLLPRFVFEVSIHHSRWKVPRRLPRITVLTPPFPPNQEFALVVWPIQYVIHLIFLIQRVRPLQLQAVRWSIPSIVLFPITTLRSIRIVRVVLAVAITGFFAATATAPTTFPWGQAFMFTSSRGFGAWRGAQLFVVASFTATGWRDAR